jgi:uncharacterized protein YceK
MSGCGTVANVHSAVPKVYGGVREMAPLGWAFCFQNDSTPEHPDRILGGLEFCMGTYLLVLETPLSAVGDTLTLPYILCRHAGQSDAGPPLAWDEFWGTNHAHSHVSDQPRESDGAPTAAAHATAP